VSEKRFPSVAADSMALQDEQQLHSDQLYNAFIISVDSEASSCFVEASSR